DEQGEPDHERVLALHRALLELRSRCRTLQGSAACQCAAERLNADAVLFHRESLDGEADLLVVARLRGAGPVRVARVRDDRVRTLLDTEDAAFAADPLAPEIDRVAGAIAFHRPGALVLSAPRG